MNKLVFAPFILNVGCSGPDPKPAAATPTIFVSVPPHGTLVERIGGAAVTTEVLLPPGQSPHTYEPSLRQVDRLASAAVYFRAGVGFENGLITRMRGRLDELRVVDLSEGLELRVLEHHHHASDGATHEPRHDADEDHHQEPDGGDDAGGHHDADDEHHHGDTDPHTWLAPDMLTTQAGTICTTLCELLPASCAGFESRRDTLQTELHDLDLRIQARLAPHHGREFLVFHPAYGYFADTYGLRQVSVEVDGKEPVARQLDDIIQRSQQHGYSVLFVQPQMSTTSAQVVADALGARLETLDPLAPDILSNLERMADKIDTALSAGAEPQ